MKIRKIFGPEGNFRYLEDFALQIGQDSGVGPKIENEFVGIKRLLLQAVFSVRVAAAVFPVAQQGMAGIGKLGADLMGAPCQQFTFHQTQLAPRAQRFIIGHGGFARGRGSGGQTPAFCFHP